MKRLRAIAIVAALAACYGGAPAFDDGGTGDADDGADDDAADDDAGTGAGGEACDARSRRCTCGG